MRPVGSVTVFPDDEITKVPSNPLLGVVNPFEGCDFVEGFMLELCFGDMLGGIREGGKPRPVGMVGLLEEESRGPFSASVDPARHALSTGHHVAGFQLDSAKTLHFLVFSE